MLDKPKDSVVNPAMAASMVGMTSDALWRTGELSSAGYIEATVVATRIYCGTVAPREGMAEAMDIWMGEDDLAH